MGRRVFIIIITNSSSHCEERSDEAISFYSFLNQIASPVVRNDYDILWDRLKICAICKICERFTHILTINTILLS
jgi:hypothetical protein